MLVKQKIIAQRLNCPQSLACPPPQAVMPSSRAATMSNTKSFFIWDCLHLFLLLPHDRSGFSQVKPPSVA